MSDDPHYQATEEAHTGPIKNPKQLLLAVFFSFIAPILIIVGLVSFVVSGTHPSGSAQGDSMALYGVSKDTPRPRHRRAPQEGRLDRDPRRQPAAGHRRGRVQGPVRGLPRRPGIPGAPHLSDAAAWGPRIGQGYATLLEHALKGKGAMPAQGGGDFDDIEIGRAVVYMANAGGATFPVPDRPAAAPAAEGAAPADAARPRGGQRQAGSPRLRPKKPAHAGFFFIGCGCDGLAGWPPPGSAHGRSGPEGPRRGRPRAPSGPARSPRPPGPRPACGPGPARCRATR